MSRLSTILLCLVAVAAVTFLAIYEPLTNSTREKRLAAEEGLVLRLDPGRIKSLRISAPDNVFEVKRRGNGWQLGPKSKDRADAALVNQVLLAAGKIRYFDRIPGSEFPSDSNLSEYGLKSPKRKIEFEGDEKITLFIGKDAASEDRIYVRTEDSRDVYLVSDEILRTAFRPAAEFRDRRLTDLAPDQIDRLIVRRAEGEIELVHDARGWQIVKPLHAPADEKKVQDYLNRLLGLNITDFVAEDTGDLGVYGLAEGQNEITFFADGSDRRQTLRFGGDKSGPFYGQFTARDSVYRLPAEAADLLTVTPDALRDRRLLPVNLDMVDKIRIGGREGNFVLRREGDGWQLVEGSQSRAASGTAVRNLADAFSTTEVASYAPALSEKLGDLGLNPPQLTVEFLSVLSENTPESRAGEQVIASATFGRVANGQVPVRISEGSEVAEAPEGILAAIPPEPSAWLLPK